MAEGGEEEEEDLGEGRRIPSPRAIYSATGAVVGSGAPNPPRRVAVQTRVVGQLSGAEDPAERTRRARVDQGGSYVTSIVARRPVTGGEFEATTSVNSPVKPTGGEIGRKEIGRKEIGEGKIGEQEVSRG
jgi:hypothetical protein